MSLSLIFIDGLSKIQGHSCIHTSPTFPFHSSRDRLVLVQPRVDEGDRNPSLTQSKTNREKRVGRQCEGSHGERRGEDH